MKSILYIVTLVAAVLILGSCQGWMSEEQQQQVISGYGNMLKQGVITESQYQALVAAAQGSKDWITPVFETVATIAGSLLGVRLWRGGINSRNGDIPKIIQS